jgi:hypothetical protein
MLASPPAATAMKSASNPELRRLVVRETDDEVLVIGQVSSFYLKQLAQEAVRSAANGRSIVNRVEVRR